MARFWVSWWSSYEPEVPFDHWVSGYRCNPNKDPFSDDAWDSASICAVIDAPSENVLIDTLSEYYPDFEFRFCEEKEFDFVPGDRFSGSTGRTALRL